MLPGLSKAACLGTLGALRPNRGWKPVRVNEFLRGVRLLPFLLTAGQAAKSLTGYGIVLGGIMGAAADSFWGVVRAAQGRSVRVEGPPSAGLFERAARYLGQPAYHVTHSALFTFEEHLLLAAADYVAIEAVRAAAPASVVFDRYQEFAATPVVELEPWHPDTRAGLTAIGWRPGEAQREPLLGVAPGATYGEVWSAIAAGHESWWSAIAVEFPRATVTSYFAQLVSEAGRNAIEYLNESPGSLAPVFEPEELAFARQFEYGIFPPYQGDPYQVELTAERAVEQALAVGREYPGPAELKLALGEIYGGFVER